MGISSVAELNAAASGQDMPGIERGACPLCERKGLPILPVRYAVCQRTLDTAEIPELSASRIEDFTEVTLDQALVEGSPRSRPLSREIKEDISDATESQVSKYILRQLRPGYLYIFDEANHPYFWYAYVITPDGMFYQFSVRDTPPPVSDAEFDCGRKPEDEKRAKALNASVVTLPSVETAQALYYAFTEHSWSRDHLRMIEGDVAWRDRHMQKIDMPAWINGHSQPHAFGIDELERVAEYSEGAVGMGSLFWPDNSDRRLFSREQMLETMQERLSHAPGRLKDKGLILAVKDEVGIIDELNAYRHEPAARLEAFLDGDDGRNRRKLTFLNAIESFKEAFRKARQQEADKEVQAELERPLGAQEMMWRSAGLHDSEADIRARANEEVDERVEDYAEDLLDYYHVKQYQDFKDKYDAVVEQVEALTEAFDADYAFWLQGHAQDVLDRYSKTDYHQGLGLSGVMANCLRGGVLSPASASVWVQYATSLDAGDSILRRLLFSNIDDLVSRAQADRQSLDDGVFFGTETLSHWVDIYNQLIEGLEPHQQQRADSRFQTVLSSLVSVIGNSLAALSLNELTHAEAEGAREALRSLMRYAQLVQVGQQTVREGEDVLPLLKRVRLKKSEYEYFLYRISRHDSRGRPYDGTAEDALQYIEGEGGNFAAVVFDNDTYVDVVLPVVDDVQALESEKEQLDAQDYAERDSALRESARAIAGRITGLHPVGKNITAGLVFWDAISTIVKGVKGPGDAEILKIIGSAVSIGAAAMYTAEGYVAVRGASLSESSALVRWTRSDRWKFAGRGFGAAGSFIAIVDGATRIQQAENDRRIGIPERIAAKQAALGGLTIAGGAIGLALITTTLPAVMFGVVMTLLVAVVGYAIASLVPLAVGMWINRSILGFHEGQVEAFRDASQELDALEMVFRGVTVELTWEGTHATENAMLPHMMPRDRQPPRVSGYPVIASQNTPEYTAKRIALKVTVPDLNRMEISLDLVGGLDRPDRVSSAVRARRHETYLYNYYFRKRNSDSSLELAKDPTSRGAGDVSSTNRSTVESSDNGYEIEVNQVFSVDDLGGGVRLLVSFRGERGYYEAKQNEFEIYF